MLATVVIQPAPQADHLRDIDIGPLHSVGRLQSKHFGVQTRTQMCDDSVRMAREEVGRPDFKLLDAQGDQKLVAPRPDRAAQPGEVAVDPVDGISRCPIAENGAQ